jgi:hypothetical protein
MFQSNSTGARQSKRRTPRVGQLERAEDGSHQAGPLVMSTEKHMADLVREHPPERSRHLPLMRDPDGRKPGDWSDRQRSLGCIERQMNRLNGCHNTVHDKRPAKDRPRRSHVSGFD